MENKWQKIETAPKDGSTILVKGGIAYWNITDKGWYSLTAINYPGRLIEWPVKHWQPLPQPPEVEHD